MKSGKIAVMVLVLMLILLCLPLPVTAGQPEAQTSISSVPSTLGIGSTDWITLTVKNVGDAKVEKMGIHFRVPPGLEIVDSDRSYDWGPSSCDEDTAVEWEWCGVSAGYSKSVEVEVKAVSSGAQEIKFRGYACSDGYANCHDEVSCSSYPCTGCSYPSSKKKTIEVPAAKPQVTPTSMPTPVPILTPTPTPPQLDSDGDGWSDEKEKLMGTNPYSVDSDSDGINDPQDPNPTVPEKRIPGFELAFAIAGLLAMAYLLRRMG